MRVTAGEMADVLRQYDFVRFPRAVGRPNQWLVGDLNAMLRYFQQWKGMNLYTSHNAYVIKDGKPSGVIVSKLFDDIDTDKGASEEDVMRDVEKKRDFYEHENWSYALVFSGQHGFHTHQMLEPTVHDFGYALSAATRGVAIQIMRKLDLKSTNIQCAEPKRLCRVPGSVYPPNGENGKMLTHCIPIHPDWLDDYKTLDDFRRLSAEMPAVPMVEYRQEGDMPTLTDMVEYMGIDLDHPPSVIEEMPVVTDYRALGDGFSSFLKMLLPLPCLHNAAMETDPPHQVRVTLGSYIRWAGLTEPQAQHFFDVLEERMNWSDRHNISKRRTAIRSLYRPRKPYFSNCFRLQAMKMRDGRSICVGKECPHWPYLEE